MASSVTTASSHSSVSSATSSIYSTASAPAALPRKDFSARNRTRGSGFGLDTISERERAAPSKKEVDAKYLAGIFGGGDNSKVDAKRKTSSLARSVEPTRAESNSTTVKDNDGAISNDERATRGGESWRAGADTTPTPVLERVAWHRPHRRRSCVQPNPIQAPTACEVSAWEAPIRLRARLAWRRHLCRAFRRPSSSRRRTRLPVRWRVERHSRRRLRPALRAKRGAAEARVWARCVTRRRARAACTLQRGSWPGGGGKLGEWRRQAGITSKSSSDAASVAEGAAAQAPKKRGMGKFLLGVRDSIKNF